MKRLDRITYYEQILDRAEAAAKQMEDALEAWDTVRAPVVLLRLG